MKICQRTDCSNEAKGFVAIDFFPMPAIMAMHNTDQPLTTVVCGIHLCSEHSQVTPTDLVGAKQLDTLIASVEDNPVGLVVDRSTIAIRVIEIGSEEYDSIQADFEVGDKDDEGQSA